MAAEDQVRELFRSMTPYPPIGLDGPAVARAARRRHRRRVALVTLPAVAVVTALVLTGTALLGQSHHPRTEPPAGRTATWHRIPDMPLSPRYLPLVAWTGNEALVIGGLDAAGIGPGQPAATILDDGAAYDPEARTWRPIAPAPEGPSGVDDTSVLVGNTLVVAHAGDLLGYDVGADSWRRLPDPPHDVPLATMAAQGSRLYLLNVNDAGGRAVPVQVLDLATGAWSTLPAGPDLPDNVLRTLVATPAGIVAMGDGLDRASAALWDGTRWTTYPATDLRGAFWHWTGERLVSGWVTSDESATPSAALDPVAGTWTALPWLPVDRPTTLWDSGQPPADGPLVFSNSTLYDDSAGTFTDVESPEPYLSDPGLLIHRRSLFTFGGYLPPPGHENDRVQQVQPVDHAWEMDLPDED